MELERGGRELDRAIAREEPAISVITVSELLHGVHRGTGAERARRHAFVEAIITAFDAIPITEPVARMHAEVRAGLARKGRMIGAHDLWIAATALAHGLGVATSDAAEFQRVPGLRVLAPSS